MMASRCSPFRLMIWTSLIRRSSVWSSLISSSSRSAYQLTRAARPLSIGLRSCLACLLPSSFKLAGHTVSGLEVRLGGWKSVAIAVFSEYVINNGVSHSLYRAYRHDKHARRRRFFDDFGTRFLAPLQASQTVSMMSVAGQNECRSLDAQRAKKPLRKLRRIIRITEPI
jgi:hypothetical protein